MIGMYIVKKEDTKKRENDDEYHGLVIDKPTYTVKRRNPNSNIIIILKMVICMIMILD